MSFFLFTASILRINMLRVMLQGKFSSELSSPEHVSVERGIFLWIQSQVTGQIDFDSS